MQDMPGMGIAWLLWMHIHWAHASPTSIVKFAEGARLRRCRRWVSPRATRTGWCARCTSRTR